MSVVAVDQDDTDDGLSISNTDPSTAGEGSFIAEEGPEPVITPEQYANIASIPVRR